MRALETLPRESDLDDDALVAAVLGGDRRSYAVLLRRYNQRIYRTIRAVLRDEDEVEDAVQQAYVAAFQALDTFRGGARFGTWLTRIALNEAFGRTRKARRFREVRSVLAEEPVSRRSPADPEQTVHRREMAELLERAIDALPETYRVVLVMRDVEELDTKETADVLELSEENVRVRLHRARALVREALHASVGDAASELFPFGGARCDRIVFGAMGRILGEG
jgi:RNA polymerase sigma-70 factor (ECF subfamily)